MTSTRLLFFFLLALTFSCQSDSKEKITVYAWTGGPGEATNEELKAKFEDYKQKGIDGLMYNGGQDPETYRRVGPIAKAAGLAFHTWIPTMVQGEKPEIDSNWYATNGQGESAFTHPAYVDYYKFLCPSEDSVYIFLSEMYKAVAEVPEVDGIHLDYIRFPDVILARGLWDKYGLVMDREYPEYDYCYCDRCVSAFAQKTGINIKEVEDPAEVQEWKQFRYDLISSLVNSLVEDIHAQGKEINAAVFPGPNSVAKRIVRQEWNKWNLDAFYPMNYNDFYLESPTWIGEVTKEGVTTIENRVPLYSGLFICPKPEKKGDEKDPENHGLLPEELATAIQTSMDNGAAGVCLFTPERMTDEHWKVFAKAIYQ